jgi:hypothetical protein
MTTWMPKFVRRIVALSEALNGTVPPCEGEQERQRFGATPRTSATMRGP